MVDDRETAIEAERDVCRKDVTYFARKYGKTQDPQAENPIRNWPAYYYLAQLLLAFVSARILIVYKKSRQMMASWAVSLYAIWKAGFFHNRQVMVQSEKEDKAKALIRRMEFILKRLPDWLMPCTYTITAQQITFHHSQGDSWIMAVPSGSDQIRSYSPSDVLFDESAFQDQIREAHEAAVPAIRGGGKIIHVSTPGPADTEQAQYFHWLVDNKAYQHITLHYTQLPPQDRPNKDELGLKDEIWEREFEGSFHIGGGKAVFKPPFSREAYVKELAFDPRLPIERALDYGVRYPACIWFQVRPETEQTYILHSWTARNMVLPIFARHIHAITRRIVERRVAPMDRGETDFSNTEFNPFEPHSVQIVDYDDPAGASRDMNGVVPRRTINKCRIYPWNRKKKIPVRESVMKILEHLEWITAHGVRRPGMLINPTCTLLIQALDGVYVIKPKTEELNSRKDGAFSGGITEHEVDCLRYGVAGHFGDD